MVKIHTDIPKELKRLLKVHAATNNTSMNALVRDYIERCLLAEIKKEVA